MIWNLKGFSFDSNNSQMSKVVSDTSLPYQKPNDDYIKIFVSVYCQAQPKPKPSWGWVGYKIPLSNNPPTHPPNHPDKYELSKIELNFQNKSC